MEIIRHYPMIRGYPYRYTNDAFDKSHEMYNDPILTEHYNGKKESILAPIEKLKLEEKHIILLKMIL